MMADNIEHVITYWVLWQRFHSPALVGFQVVSHWLPFLMLSVWFGGLAERRLLHPSLLSSTSTIGSVPRPPWYTPVSGATSR